MGEQPSDLRGCWLAEGSGSSHSRAAICVHASGGLQLLFIMMIRKACEGRFFFHLIEPVTFAMTGTPPGELDQDTIASRRAVLQAKAGGQSLRRYVREGTVL